MTTSQQRCQNHSSAPLLAQPRTSQPRTSLPRVPPPQFGRFPGSARLLQAAGTFFSEAGDARAEGLVPTAEAADTSSGADPPLRPGPLASFGPRMVGFLIDCVLPVIVLNLLLAIVAVSGGARWRLPIAAVGCVILLILGFWNSGYLQGTTGRSLGRRVANTMLVGLETDQPVGVGPAVARQLCHVLEFGVGFLWPLWDGKRQTFADKIVGTVVVQRVSRADERSGGSAKDRRRSRRGQ
ncbi:MAG TPA: RDD family protein [Pseudonocardiaceae bacterium]|nr:RDD family protein [Pseudonocardiaceae bacterium]